jgi:hypothetical protein
MMPEIPNQLIHPELQPHDDGSNAHGVGVSPQPLAVPYQPQQPLYAQPPTSQPLPLLTPQQQWQQPMPPQQEWQAQPQMYPPQQYQQPPQYQPPMPPQVAPKKPKSRKRLWLIIGVVVLVLIVIVAVASQAGKGGQPTPATSQATQPASTSQQPQPTAKPTQPSGNTIGKAVQVGNTWVVTINSAKTHAGSEFSQPKSGNTYLVVDVTLKNISSSNQTASSLLMFNLKDQTGQTYTDTFADFAKASPDGNVSAGGLLRGEIVYEVPSSMHAFTFSFQPGFDANELAEWNVTI